MLRIRHRMIDNLCLSGEFPTMKQLWKQIFKITFGIYKTRDLNLQNLHFGKYDKNNPTNEVSNIFLNSYQNFDFPNIAKNKERTNYDGLNDIEWHQIFPQ